MIEVTQIGKERFEVKVRSEVETKHLVTLTDQYLRKLTNGAETAEKLIERSFRFLLEREPNTAILRSFELSVIGTYFPEYEEKIRLK